MSRTIPVGTARRGEVGKILDAADGLVSRSISASAARGELNKILDAAECGKTTLVLRHSKPSAAIIPAKELDAYRLARRLLRELSETIELSDNADVIAAVRRAQADIAEGNIVWYER